MAGIGSDDQPKPASGDGRVTSFLKSGTGIVTALATLVAAIAGLVTALSQFGGGDSPQQPQRRRAPKPRRRSSSRATPSMSFDPTSRRRSGRRAGRPSTRKRVPSRRSTASTARSSASSTTSSLRRRSWRLHIARSSAATAWRVRPPESHARTERSRVRTGSTAPMPAISSASSTTRAMWPRSSGRTATSTSCPLRGGTI